MDIFSKSVKAMAVRTAVFAGATFLVAGVHAAGVSEKLQAKVPEEYGKQFIGVYDPQYPPSYFIDEQGEMAGYVLDFQHAVAERLGLESVAEQAKFASIIQGVLSNRYNVSYFHDTPERREKMDFVDVHSTGTVVMVKKGNTKDIDLDNLCGFKVGVAAGAHQQLELMPKLQEQCAEEGKPEIQELAFSGMNEGSMAVSTERADAWLGDSPAVGYTIKQTGGQFEVTPTPHIIGYSGFAFTKGDPMAQVVQEAINEMIQDGSYLEILKDWNMESMALDKALLNGE